jgi:hypothetical protein
MDIAERPKPLLIVSHNTVFGIVLNVDQHHRKLSLASRCQSYSSPTRPTGVPGRTKAFVAPHDDNLSLHIPGSQSTCRLSSASVYRFPDHGLLN